MKKKKGRTESKTTVTLWRASLVRKSTAGHLTQNVDKITLFEDLRSLIHSAHQHIAVVANSAATLL